MEQKKILEEQIIIALKHVFDPEIPVNIYDLGLVYDVKIDDQANITVTMTLTAPNCPVAEDMPSMVREEIRKIEGINTVNVEIVFDPPWDMDMITEEAKLQLGLL